MSIPLDPITLNAGRGVTVPLTNPNMVQAIKIANKSQYDLQLGGVDVGLNWLVAGVEDLLPTQSNIGAITIEPYNTALISPAPTGICLITQYMKDEPLPGGHWPVTIPTQSVSVNSMTLTAANLQNDGGTVGAQIIEVTPQGDNTSTFLLTNDSHMTLGDPTHPAVFTCNGDLNVSAPSSFDAGRTNTDGAGNWATTGYFKGATLQSTGVLTAGGITDSGTLAVTGTSSLDNGKITTDGNSNLALTDNGQVIPGTTAGTVTIWQFFRGGAGSGLKQVLMLFSGYQNSTSARQNFTLPSPFLKGAVFQVGGCHAPDSGTGAYFVKSGTVQNLNAFTAYNTHSVKQIAECYSSGEINSGFDTVQVDGSTTGAASGWIELWGV